MNVQDMTDAEVYRQGLEVLLDTLGDAGTIRFLEQCEPSSGDYTAKPMREAAESDPKFANGAMQKLEKKCLTDLKLFDDKKISEEKVLESVNKYSALLQRKKTYNHFSERHQELLNERPWEKCKVCKDAGINIVVFRGANRNRRRGFHNTWVFYHKILHGGPKKSSEK